MTARGTGAALDNLAALEDERTVLLRSLTDLEREHQAGDLDDADYAALKDDYTARTAEVIRQINDAKIGVTRQQQRTATLRGPAWRKPTAIVVTLAAALGAGIAVARSAGERVGNQGLTGTIRSAGTDKIAEIEELLATARKNLSTNPLTSLQSYDKVLNIDPENPEAVTYGGWLLRIVAQSAEGTQREELLRRATERLDTAVDVAPGYPDARAFRGILRLRDLDNAVGANEDFTALAALDPPEFVKQLVGTAADEAKELAQGPATTSPPS
jgi:hypothetical protein